MENFQTSSPGKQDNRRYYRLQPKEEQEPQAFLEFDDHKVDLTVVNLSPGGLLCYISAKETDVHKDLFIPKITIQAPNKKPVEYSGRVLRVEEVKESESKFCAIEYVRFQKKVLSKGSKPISDVTPVQDSDRFFIHRLESIKFIDGPHSIKEEIHEKEMLYNAFEDITNRLPIEERWFFIEVLDLMKSREPNYPEDLKLEFLRFCRGEDRSEFTLEKEKGGTVYSWIKGLFHETAT